MTRNSAARSAGDLVAGAFPLAAPRKRNRLLALCLFAITPLPAQTSFPTPQVAAKALVSAAELNDTGALLKLFGPEGKPIVDSGDPAEDRSLRMQFAKLAQEKMQIQSDANHATILVGSAEWPFPVPLVQAKGQWHFDTPAGKVEVLARRIGRNELNAVEVCRGYVEAQMQYASADRDTKGVLEYAQKMVSSPGKKDGLYWESESALVPRAFADAAAAMGEGHKLAPYHGYYFRILKAQGPDAPGGALDYVVKGKMIGGFALVAWPAEYGVSGIEAFLVNHKGIVYEKDLGASTAASARQMTRFDPDKTWKPVTLE
ncbi:MAG: DUF2950 domain-containing protein [Bryobacteraceae bacterium]|jgi:hypothetical protein